MIGSIAGHCMTLAYRLHCSDGNGNGFSSFTIRSLRIINLSICSHFLRAFMLLLLRLPDPQTSSTTKTLDDQFTCLSLNQRP